MIAPPSEPLLYFFEMTYLSERKLTEKSAECYRKRIRRFDRWHGREVLLSDLADGLLERFQADLTRQTSAKKAYEAVGNIRCVWRLASGGESYKPRTGEPGTLRHFFETVYTAERKLTSRAVITYRHQITRLERWCGDEILLSELTDDLLDQFQSDLAQRTSTNHATLAVKIIRCVWKLASDVDSSTAAPISESKVTQELVEGDDDNESVSLWALYRDRYEPQMLALRSPNTRHQYKVQLRHFARYLGCTPTTAHLTDEVMSAFLVDRAGGGRAPATSNKARNHLLSIWRWCNRKGLVKIGPDVAKAPEPLDPPVAFTIPELKRLFDAADDAWWEALLRAIFDTGERIGAVMQWEWEMLDLETGDLIVLARIRKGRRRGQVYRLRPPTLELLRTLDKRKYIFQGLDAWGQCTTNSTG